MLSHLQNKLKKACRWLPVAALLPLMPFAAQAQALNYSPGSAANVTGTYTDLGTGGTAIATANTDDANSAAQPIGFTLTFNGAAFTQFVLNTNGFVKLGAAAPSAADLYYHTEATFGGDALGSTNAADINIVAPFNVDLQDGTATGGAEYRVSTTGTAGSRICTIQWKNVRDKMLTNSPQYDSFSFQARLFEGTNNIEFVYAAPVAGTTGTDVFRLGAAGIKGSGIASGQTVLVNKTTSAAAWSTAGFITGIYTGSALNYRRVSPPDAGRTFRFSPSAANDGSITAAALYIQGQLSTVSPPQVVRAVVSNTGTAAYTTGTATLTVTRGATTLFTDTKTVAATASGASTTVSFAPYTAAVMANTGTNTVTVTLSNDDNNANNTATLDQLVTATAFNYASPASATAGGVSFGATGTGNVGSRFSTTTAVQVTSVQMYAANGTGTVIGILFDATGNELGRSAARTLATADAGTVITLPLTTSVTVPAGDFFAGVNLAGTASLGTQLESPTRTGTYYQITAAPATNDLAANNLGRFNLGVVTAPAVAPSCGVATGLTATNVTSTSATVGFTPASGATSYTVTYTPAGGTPTTVTPAPTASPISLTGLTPNTAYTVSITTNCAAGQTSAAATITFTTATPPITNDDPTGAITLPLAATCTPTNGTNVGATTTTANGYTNPGCGIAVNPKDVWFKFTTAATGAGSTFVRIQVTGNPAGQVRVFSAASNAGPFTEVGCASSGANNMVAGTLSLPSLTPNTTYYVFVSGYGSGDTQGAFTICATGQAALVPSYASLPYTESFEGPWVDKLATRDVPTVNWVNTPASGNTSWRRDDDGASANWSFLALGGYTPAFSTGAHSARFHSYGAAAATAGTLDLFVNLSGATGNRVLTFDYVNLTGTDSLRVFVSTNGGTTFSPAPVLSAATSASFTNKTVTIPSTSATSVIRFKATSDFGDDDIGIDNLRIAIVTATRNDALAATVSLSPNPAHQSFQLMVPAGSLHAATATLRNTLGQVVQSRQLNLPVSGGTADFNVSSLAAGVYTLTLKSGDDFIVKRVVVE